MMISRLLCLFLCVGVSVEELEQNFISNNVNLVKENNVNSFPARYDKRRQMIPIGPPTVNVTISIVKGQIGDSLRIECFMDSNPQPINYWMRGSERIFENNTKYKIQEDLIQNFIFRYRLRLHILNLEKEDFMDKFYCFSNNQFGEDKGVIQIQVLPPIVKTLNNTIEGSLGSDVNLICNVTAYPLASTYWFNSTGEQIVGYGRFSLFNEEPTLFRYKIQLRIENLTRTDFTSYKCMATNRIGSDHQIIHLTKGKKKPTRVQKNDGQQTSRLTIYYILIVFSNIIYILKYT